MPTSNFHASTLACLGFLALTACSGGSAPQPAGAPAPTPSASAGSEAGAVTAAPPPPAGPQTPPTKGADVEKWLAQGAYKAWHCEPTPHVARAPSPHGINRVCSNDLTSAFTATGERPVGSAGVKELYDAAGTTVTGYAVYLKTEAESKDGATWYWYERRSDGVVGDGLGTAGIPKDVCVSCHSGAAPSAMHPGASDYVWTQVAR